ncbi:uncharacterized protein O3C94_001422 [Discoglossus pictus]
MKIAVAILLLVLAGSVSSNLPLSPDVPSVPELPSSEVTNAVNEAANAVILCNVHLKPCYCEKTKEQRTLELAQILQHAGATLKHLANHIGKDLKQIADELDLDLKMKEFIINGCMTNNWEDLIAMIHHDAAIAVPAILNAVIKILFKHVVGDITHHLTDILMSLDVVFNREILQAVFGCSLIEVITILDIARKVTATFS